MRKIVIRLIFGVLAMLSQSALASPSPDELISEILAKDFGGDGAFRVGKVIYRADDRSANGECDCDVPREAFLPALSPIVIVSNWHLDGTKILSSNVAVATATFEVIATTEGEGDVSNGARQRKIFSLPEVRIEKVEYRLIRKDEDWMLTNPPLPRVGIRGVIDSIRKQIGQFPPESRRTSAVQNAYLWETQQLSTLEAMSVR